MLSQFAFVLKIKIKQASTLLFYVRFSILVDLTLVISIASICFIILLCFIFQDMFTSMKVVEAVELGLGANVPLSDIHRLQWKTKSSNRKG